MLKKTGIPTLEDLKKVMPPKERLKKGPVAIIECFEKIPCDPCYTYCSSGAIEPFKNINDLPKIDFNKCNGCAVCVANCPGLAIFIVDETYSTTEDLVILPYEFLPVPAKGDKVILLNRTGEKVGYGRVERVRERKNKTRIIDVAVPKGLGMEVRHIKGGKMNE